MYKNQHLQSNAGHIWNKCHTSVNETLVKRGFDTYIVEGQVLCDVLVVFCTKKLLLKAKGVIQNV